jgi:hypothetical protein
VTGTRIVRHAAEKERLVDFDDDLLSAERLESSQVGEREIMERLPIRHVAFDSRAAGGERLQRGRFNLNRHIVRIQKRYNLLQRLRAGGRDPAGVKPKNLCLRHGPLPRCVILKKRRKIHRSARRRSAVRLWVEPNGRRARNG